VERAAAASRSAGGKVMVQGGGKVMVRGGAVGRGWIDAVCRLGLCGALPTPPSTHCQCQSVARGAQVVGHAAPAPCTRSLVEAMLVGQVAKAGMPTRCVKGLHGTPWHAGRHRYMGVSLACPGLFHKLGHSFYNTTHRRKIGEWHAGLPEAPRRLSHLELCLKAVSPCPLQHHEQGHGRGPP
jgi:hypothetical protein